VTGASYHRHEQALWREGIDRVLVHLPAGEGVRSFELGGAEALVWLSLDEPTGNAELAQRLADFAAVDAVDAALANLRAEGLLKQ